MKIRVIYDPILRQKVNPVTVFDAELKDQAEEMVSLMKENAGIGLAGNQVGLNKRMIVCGYKPTDKDDEMPEIPFQRLVNPRVINTSKEKDVINEGCLSLPGLELPVERSTRATIEAQDLNGNKIIINAKDLHARVLLHEIDHLNGILFTDHVKNYKKLKDYQFARIVFCGSDDFSAPIFNTLIESGCNVIAAITETDKPAGRGQGLNEPIIKKLAQKNNIAVFQPEDKEELTYVVRQINPDLLVLASYGKILPEEALEAAVFGCLNVHPSLLPKFRGATPIQSTILSGEKETGVTIMEMAAKVDAGGIIIQEKVVLTDSETSLTLKKRLAELGATMIVKAIPMFLSGQVKIVSQKNEEATGTKKLTKEMGELNWTEPAVTIDRKVRALNPWPGTYTYLAGKRLRIITAKLRGEKIEPLTVQIEGKKETNWPDFKRGHANQLTKEPWFSKIVE